MGGDVYMERSEFGIGSTFAIILPLSGISTGQSNAANLTPNEDKTVKIQGELSGIHILLVDDSEDNRMLAAHVLTKKGASIVEANNGSEAIRLALENTFSVVLMDIQMPVMDGLEATKRLRAEKYKVPIIALTAHAMAEERDRCLKAGADAHLSKPFQFDELSQLILKLVKK